MQYDQVYHDDQRPDLMITNENNDNIVMVEVDENPHFTIKHLREDDARFKAFYEESKENGKSLSVVRVVPGEKSKTSMFKTSGKSLYKNNGYIEKNPEHYNKYIKESVSKIVKIIDDKQSYRYKDTQVSIGPTIKKKSHSPIFSDTSSPDVSITVNRARAILKPETDPEESLSFQLKSLAISSSYYPFKSKTFSKNQKRHIVNMIQNRQDISSYVSGITGKKYKSSNIKLTDRDPIEVHLHVIQGAALGYKDSLISLGADKLKKESSFRKKSFFQYGKPVSPPALPKKISRSKVTRRNAVILE